jgi:hypothetical protein
LQRQARVSIVWYVSRVDANKVESKSLPSVICTQPRHVTMSESPDPGVMQKQSNGYEQKRSGSENVRRIKTKIRKGTDLLVNDPLLYFKHRPLKTA